MWGYASSPVLHGNLCFLNFGPGERSFIIALDKRSGRTVWKYDVPPVRNDTKYEELGGDPKWAKLPGALPLSEIAGSWATPLLVHAARGDELVVALPVQLLALTPRTGEKLWNCRGPSLGAYSSAFFGDGIIGLTGNGFRNIAMAVRPGGKGDVTATRRLWFSDRADSKGCVGSGVIFQGHIYLVTVAGIVECHDLKTGQMIWEERLTGTGARNQCWASPVLAEGRLYIPTETPMFSLFERPRVRVSRHKLHRQRTDEFLFGSFAR